MQMQGLEPFFVIKRLFKSNGLLPEQLFYAILDDFVYNSG